MNSIFLFFLLLHIVTDWTSRAEAVEKKLRIALVQEWGSFNPVNNQLASTDAVLPFTIRKVVFRNSSGEVLPDVAEVVPKIKGRTAIWTLKSNAFWSDGKGITCADWHFAWQVGSHSNVSTIAREDYSKIENISWNEAHPKVCKVLYRKANWYDRDLPALLPAHIERAIFEKYKNQPEGYDRNSNYNTNPTLAGLYNGPYQVSEFKLGSHAVFSVNPYFFGTRAKIEKIVLKHISDTSALKAHLLSKEIDVISAVGFPPDVALQFENEFQSKGLNYKVHFQDSSIFQGLFFNLENEVLKDSLVREALSLAVDKELLVKAFFNDRLRPAQGIIPPPSPAFRNLKMSSSKKRALEILESGQWKLSSKGVREKGGKALSFVFKTSAGIKVLELIQQQICDSYKSIGVLCNIKNEPPRVLLGSSVPHGEFDLTMFGQPVPPDSSMTSYFSSKEIPTAANSWAGGNLFRLKSEKVDELLKQFDSEKNLLKRTAVMQKIEDQLIKNHFMIPLYHRREAIVAPVGLKGISQSFDGTGFNLPEYWTLDEIY